MKKRLYLCHAQGRYGDNTYIPLSVGVLWAYAQTFPEITDAYEMIDFLYLKESIEKAVSRLVEPNVLALAHYIWNAEWNKALARAVKAKWPNCTILVGGVQVQDESPKILEENPYFDFAIYGEGEGAFVDFLQAHSQPPSEIQYVGVGSLIYRTHSGIVTNARRAFVDLAELRSPYLDGVFDELWKREPRWQILHETSRGCVYQCIFCAWGQAALNELRLFPEERIFAELEWFGKHQVDYIDNADANYGIVKRDIELAKALVAVKAKHGYPKTFRTSFAKNSNEIIWQIANILHEAKMLKSVTLAMQSMNDDVLVNIKRKNIKFSKFGDWLQRYEEAGIPTYTEIILGLPGETLDTFLDGIDKNLEAGQHTGLFTYCNIMLNNTEQNTPEYIKTYGLRTLPLQAMLTHGTPDDSVPREKQEIVVATSSMVHIKWKHAYLHGKVIEIFHAQGLLQELAIICHERGMRYREFYGQLLTWCLDHPWTVAGCEVTRIHRLLDGALAGGSWDCVDLRFGDISWPPEEFAFIRICCDLDKFWFEMEPFLTERGLTQIEIDQQREAIIGPVLGDEARWAREVVWYQRKGYSRKLRRAS